MNLGKVAGAVVLAVVWATVPGDFLRWASAALALTLTLSALWSLVLDRGLILEPLLPELRSFGGRVVDVAFRLENQGPLPTGILFVTDSAGGLEVSGVTRRFVRLGPFSKWRHTYTVRGWERGRRTLGPLTLTAFDPASLFPIRRRGGERSLIVYPSLRPVDAWPRNGTPPGLRSWERAWTDDQSRFRAFRDFEAGDSLNRVSASAWARQGYPQVRTFDWTVERPTVVVLDLTSSRYPLRLRWDLLEAAVETAASLVWGLLGRGERVWLSVRDAADEPDLMGPGRGWADARLFLERLSLAAAIKEDAPIESPLLPPPPATLYWVAPESPLAEGLPGYEVVLFPIREGRERGRLAHP